MLALLITNTAYIYRWRGDAHNRPLLPGWAGSANIRKIPVISITSSTVEYIGSHFRRYQTTNTVDKITTDIHTITPLVQRILFDNLKRSE